ncbi:MAG: DsbA family protein, partial [Nannocystaceae bacterium]
MVAWVSACARPSDAPAPAEPTPPVAAPLAACTDPGDDPAGLEMSAPQRAAGIPCLRYNVKIGDAPTRGPDDAPVTIVMFSDFECPFCERAMQTIHALERRYEGEIRLVYKSFPIARHPQAMLAALMAMSAAEQGAFWGFHDRLFSGQGIDTPTLLQHVDELGIDMERVAKDLDTMAHAPAVRRDLAQASQLLVRSTPTFFINGRRVSGAKPLAFFEALVEEERAFASTWRAAGVADEMLYTHATRLGYEEIEYDRDPTGLDESKVYPVPIEESPSLGPVDAPVTIVVFGDFQCPFCARGHQTLRAIKDRYGDQIRLVYKHFPLPGHPAAIPAARASMVANAQGKFWQFHDALYETGARFSAEDLREIGMRVALEGAADAWTESKEFDAQIKRDIELGMTLGVTGTPTSFVNGRPVQGAQSEIMFRSLIAEEMARANALKAQGVSGDALYPALVGLDAN